MDVCLDCENYENVSIHFFLFSWGMQKRAYLSSIKASKKCKIDLRVEPRRWPGVLSQPRCLLSSLPSQALFVTSSKKSCRYKQTQQSKTFR